jgi:hypothetical protein
VDSLGDFHLVDERMCILGVNLGVDGEQLLYKVASQVHHTESALDMAQKVT